MNNINSISFKDSIVQPQIKVPYIPRREYITLGTEKFDNFRPADQFQYQPNVNQRTKQQITNGQDLMPQVKFSRFSAWHLPQMAQNKQIFRELNQINFHVFQKLQDSSQSQQEDQSYLLGQQSQGWSYKIQKGDEAINPAIKTHMYVKKTQQKLSKPKQTGLRKLSGKAYKIVKQLGEVTYKQVALRLIKQILEDQTQFDDEKQQNNIKRRVYDALNVLIAMGILTKQGKNIAYGLDPTVQSLNLTRKQQKQKYMRQLDNKKKQLARKKQHRRRLSNRIKSLAQLVSRNKFQQYQQNLQINHRIHLNFVGLQIEEMNSIKISENKDFFRAKIHQQTDLIQNLDFIHKIFTEKTR